MLGAGTKTFRSKTQAAEVQVHSITDFLTILRARERSQAPLFTNVRNVIKSWFSTASATNRTTQRAVWITPLTVEPVVLLSFSFKDTIVSHRYTGDQGAKLLSNPRTNHHSLTAQTKAQLEGAIAALGLAIPVFICHTQHHKEQRRTQRRLSP